MNKFKKIAAVVVSTVMAGTMALSLTACGPGDDGDSSIPPSSSGSTETDYKKAPDLFGVVNKDTGAINYSAYSNRNKATLNIAIGHNSDLTSTSYKNLSGQATLPDGKTYEQGNLKPAWVAMGNDLNVTWNDVYENQATSANLTHIAGGQAQTAYADTDMFTTDLSIAVTQASGGTNILNLADYLDYMPHFTAFLNSNPVVYLSLLQYGMDTTTGENKTLYVAPYFDGYDDIERYCLIRTDWTNKLLNGDADISGTAAFGKATSVVSYMGQTGEIEIESTNATGELDEHSIAKKITITKNYDAVVNALKATTTNALKTAYEAIATDAYDGTSGNIVDVMNKALEKNSNATGEQLTKLFRAYIDVCYEGHYGADRRADLFNGYDACWDVDDLVAMLRCITASGTALTSNQIRGIAPRDGTNDRTPDIVSLAGQLYGVRGTTSRYEHTYIDAQGKLQDARNDAKLYEALGNMNLLLKEGLIADYSQSSFKGAQGVQTANGVTYESFMLYDYSQTQTLNGFYVEDKSLTGVTMPAGYKMSPVITPVSKWDVNGNGSIDDGEIFRFTESWRSTKTGGLALNGNLANTGNEDKLKAALQFVDYLYSEDGQIVSTYGPRATDANSTDGFWYDEPATEAQINAGAYYTYKGVKYAGYQYKDKYAPTVTQKLIDSFKGKEVNGYQLKKEKDDAGKAKASIGDGILSFTSYARMIIGSTLPVGVKNQAFEDQLTSQMGREGVKKVGLALANGTIKGVSLKLNSSNWWFTCVPSGLPINPLTVTNVLNASNMDQLVYISGKNPVVGGKTQKDWYNIFNCVVLNGASATYNQKDRTVTYTSLEDLKNKMSTDYLAQTREDTMAVGWNTSVSYWNYLSSLGQ